MSKRLVPFVEGQGDCLAVPNLVSRLLISLNLASELYVDTPIRVGEYPRLIRNDAADWKRRLARIRTKDNLAGVLLFLDGDCLMDGFCVAEAASMLADSSRLVGGGSQFSVAVVFAKQEYESWLIAMAPKLAGTSLPDGRPGLKAECEDNPANVEESPRAAKDWLGRKMIGGTYKPTTHQLPLTQLVHIEDLRAQGLRSFARLENALAQIGEAARSDCPIISPNK